MPLERDNLVIESVEQGSDEWLAMRAGVITASGASMIVTPTGKMSSQMVKYACQLAGERALNRPSDDSIKSFWMKRGNIMEDGARLAYQMLTENDVKTVGFVYMNHDLSVGCSPDGLVGDDGGVEIKSPKLGTHMMYLYENTVPSEYLLQVQASLYITGRKWWDFFSYYPGVEPVLVRAYPDKSIFEAIDKGFSTCLDIIKDVSQRLSGVALNEHDT